MPERERQHGGGAGPGAWARLLRWLGSRRVIVHDRSMSPTLEPGDRLLVEPYAPPHRRPRQGDLVVLVDPEDAGRWLVKRVAGVAPAAPDERADRSADRAASPRTVVYVLSDAEGPTRDSRRFGAVPVDQLLGRVYRRYRPWSRRADW